MFRLSHWLKVKNIDVNNHHHIISDPNWRKFQPKLYIWMSATSLVFSSKLSLPSMVSSTINSHLLSVARHVESVNNFHIHQNNRSISHLSWRKFQLMWCILMSAIFLVNVNVNVFLADHSAIHHQPKCPLCGQPCQKCKQLSFKPPSPQHIKS